MEPIINVKFLNDLAKMPTKGSKYAVGYDLYAATDYAIDIAPHNTVKIGTGLAIELPTYMAGLIFARSGLATKKGLRPANCVGLIDPDYRGEYIVALHNDTDEIMSIEPGERIAQLVFTPFYSPELERVDEISETERGANGFGSTGVV